MNRALCYLATLTGLTLVAGGGDWMLSHADAQREELTSLIAPRAPNAQGQLSADVVDIGLPDTSGFHSDLSVLDQVLAAKMAMEEVFKPLSPSTCPSVTTTLAKAEDTPDVAQ